jgi:glycosyltransferase 2 family protein
MKFKKSLLIGILGIIVIYAIILIAFDINIISEKIGDFDSQYLPIIISLIPLTWGVLFLRWNLLLKNSDIDIPLKDNFMIFISGFALGVTPGKVGELIKSQLLKNKFNIPRTKTAPLVIVERFYDFFAIAIISLFGILVFEYSIYIFGILAIGISIFLIITSSEKIFLKFLNKIEKINFLKNFSNELPKSFNVIQKSTRGKIFPLSITLSVIFWFLDSIIAYLTLLSFGIDIIDYFVLMSIYTSSIILGVISFLPLGIGVVEGSLVGFLSLNGIEFHLATAIVVFIRFFTRWIGVMAGFIGLKFSNILSD